MTLLENQPAAIPAPREITTKPRVSDQIFRAVVTVGGMSSLIILGLIALFLSLKGINVLRVEQLSFITESKWEVLQDAEGKIAESTFGLGAMLIGTFLSAFIAVIVGVPIAVLSALYLTFYARGSAKKLLVSLIDLMAAFPSLLFGFWGFIVLMGSAEYWAKLLNKYLGFIPLFDVPAPIFERSPFIAGLVLAIMIIPIVTAISREIFDQTPLDRIQAAYALGASKLSMIRAVVIPYGRGGVVGGAAYNGVPAAAMAGAGVVHVEVNIDQSGNATTTADTPALSQFGSELGKFVEQKYRELLAKDLRPNGQIGRTMAGGYR